VEQGCNLEGFYRIGAHCQGRRSSIWLEDIGSEKDLVTGVLAIPIETFLIILWGFITPYLFILIVGRVYLKEGAPRHRNLEFGVHIYSYSQGNPS
jgi:hypothetical protein